MPLEKFCITLHPHCRNCCRKKESLEIQPRLEESIKERQDGIHKKAMNDVAKEFDKKLIQVHEHYRTMQKNNEDEIHKITK